MHRKKRDVLLLELFNEMATLKQEMLKLQEEQLENGLMKGEKRSLHTTYEERSSSLLCTTHENLNFRACQSAECNYRVVSYGVYEAFKLEVTNFKLQLVDFC